jgi:hypothetical protein
MSGGTQGDIMNDPATLARLTKAFEPAAPAADFNDRFPAPSPKPFGPADPSERVNHGHDAFGVSPMQTAMATPAPMPGEGFGRPAAPVVAQSTPMPAPRPAAAPQAPEQMGFFQRNTAMMTDPMSGEFIDPTSASKASGPDVIAKLMDYFHKKDPS